MAKVVAVTQLKGGSGKSTVATNLAAALVNRKKRVALIDADPPQSTATAWHTVRVNIGRAGSLTLTAVEEHRELVDKITELSGVDFILIDGPPRIAGMTRAAIVSADLVLIPVAASLAEVWATADIAAILEQARAIRPEIQARIVWTRHRPATTLAREITALASDELGIDALETVMTLRQAYIEALGAGLSAAELHDPTAGREVELITDEVVRILR
jgi:chromosome partitioning protein